VKINGKLYVTFKELAKLLGLPDDIMVEGVSCSLDDMAGGAFMIHVHNPQYFEIEPLEHAPILHREQQKINDTRDVRCRVAQATDEIAKLITTIEWQGYECKGEPLEDDSNFKRLAEIVGVEL
jgi:hypothetical protein